MSDPSTRPPQDSHDVAAEYQALKRGAGLVDLGQRTQIELTGEDRSKFLHNLCTNEIRRLTPGSGCEAFLLNAQGKILFHVLVFCTDEALVLDTVHGQGEPLRAHLDRYLIREQVGLADRSSEFVEFLLHGPGIDIVLGKLSVTPPAGRLDHCAVAIGKHEVQLRRVDLCGPGGMMFNCPSHAGDDVPQALADAGATLCGAEAFEIARIEAGFPLFGRDITTDNLPQEVARDDRAISFVKGCYIGQETVARIDALGHVNKTLCGLRITGAEAIAPGAELTLDGKAVGQITSAAKLPSDGITAALGFVRRGSNSAGTTLRCGTGTATIVART